MHQLSLSDWINLVAIVVTLIGILIGAIGIFKQARGLATKQSQRNKDKFFIDACILTIYTCCALVIILSFLDFPQLTIIIGVLLQFLVITWMRKTFVEQLRE